jgi:hypothetical protein
MNEKYIDEKFKQTDKQLDEHDRRISDLEKTYTIMQKMDLRVGNIEEAVKTINSKLDGKTEEKGKKWDKLIDYIFYFVIALLLGLLVKKLGLK